MLTRQEIILLLNEKSRKEVFTLFLDAVEKELSSFFITIKSCIQEKKFNTAKEIITGPLLNLLMDNDEIINLLGDENV